jgi:hypothetical protein
MTDVVEVYWDAGPVLRWIGLSLDASGAERQAQALFGEATRTNQASFAMSSPLKPVSQHERGIA